MPRTKSRPSHATASRKPRNVRSSIQRSAARADDASKVQRYIDFVRTVLGSSRNGR